MTEPTSNLPAARPRKRLTQIAPVSWEPPADRAALQSLRSIPGFDLVVKKISGFIGERGIRLLFQADAVRVGPKQFPCLNDLYTDVLTTLDWDPRPELFVSQTPFVNAGAYGMDSRVRQRRDEAARVHRIDDYAALGGKVSDVAHVGSEIAALVMYLKSSGKQEDNFATRKVACVFDQRLETEQRVARQGRGVSKQRRRARLQHRVSLFAAHARVLTEHFIDEDLEHVGIARLDQDRLILVHGWASGVAGIKVFWFQAIERGTQHQAIGCQLLQEADLSAG